MVNKEEKRVGGMASSILEAMGWKDGEGLGKDKQGRTEHLVASKRGERAGIGREDVDAEERKERNRDWWRDGYNDAVSATDIKPKKLSKKEKKLRKKEEKRARKTLKKAEKESAKIVIKTTPKSLRETDVDFHEESAGLTRIREDVWMKKLNHIKAGKGSFSYEAFNQQVTDVDPEQEFGRQAAKDLFVTRGETFRKEKAKKKKAGWSGGHISFQSRSIRFDD